MEELSARLGVDVFSAAVSSAAISPLIFMIDKSIMEYASGRTTSIKQSLRSSASMALRTPISFVSSVPFLLLYSVYFSTYATANVFDTLSSRKASTQLAWNHQTNSFGKFVATTVVNLGTCVYKDQSFARRYGVGVQKRMPLATLMLFAARDSLTVLASFNIPPLLAPAIGLNAAQILTPCAMQFISTPMHLFALDLFNREREPLKSRIEFVKRGYLRSTFARVGRILPAFGVGGVLNREVRSASMLSLKRN